MILQKCTTEVHQHLALKSRKTRNAIAELLRHKTYAYFGRLHCVLCRVKHYWNVRSTRTYITVTDLILENKIPELLVSFNEILAKGFDSHHFVSGLASHFRDLLVKQNSFDISTTGSWEQAQKMYGLQAQNALKFLAKGNYYCKWLRLKVQAYQNQRLLVELCLMQLASITFDGEKKNWRIYNSSNISEKMIIQ
jgi:DNA polymerase III gamma/tau subunit